MAKLLVVMGRLQLDITEHGLVLEVHAEQDVLNLANN